MAYSKMKNLSIDLATLCLLSLTMLVSCRRDGSPDKAISKAETQARLLTGTWTAVAVSFDGVSRIDTWGDNFKLTISDAAAGSDDIWGGSYTTADKNTQNEPDADIVFPSQGTWTFAGVNDVQSIIRDDKVKMDITDVTDASLTLKFTIPEPAAKSARVEGIFGQIWEFEFTKSG